MAYWGEVEIIENYASTAENLSNCVARFYACTDTGSTWSNYSSTATCTLDTVTEQKTIASFDFRQSKKILIGEVWADIIHNSDGTKTAYAYFSWNSNHSQVGTIEADATKVLTNIPRYASFTEHYVSSTGLNSITVKWNANARCDAVQYSLNGSNWVSTSGLSYTISGLNPNTKYSIKTRVRRQDSQLWTESSTIYGTTKNIAKITTCSNFNLGDTLHVTYTNPSNASLKIGIYKNDGTTAYVAYRTATGSNYTFNFTDEELDRLYKDFANANAITVRVYLRTSGDTYYYDTKDITVTLTGNQKTGHINVNNNWKRSKKWVNVNGIWKRCVRWVNVNGTWKRCI